MHVHFLIPCYGGHLSEATFTSFVRFILQAPHWGIEWSMDTLVNESLIPRGRNALVARALLNQRATHLMFLDADVAFEPEHIAILVEADVDVIGGGYPKKSLPIDYVINPLPDGIHDDDKAEVERLGTGFMLLKRQVFERMAEAMPELKYRDDCGLDPAINDHLYAFFECGLFGHGVFMSEDWLFCNRWRALGGKIFISKRFALSHIGTYCFSETAQAALLARLALQPPTSLVASAELPPAVVEPAAAEAPEAPATPAKQPRKSASPSRRRRSSAKADA